MRTAAPPRSVAVLDDALAWTRAQLERARGHDPAAPTPCRDWDLADLLRHMDDSLAAIGEAAELGLVAVPGPGGCPPADTGELVDRVVGRACRTRAAWQSRLTSAPVAVGDLPLGRDTLVLVSALEVSVHGWDVAWACGRPGPVPAPLATALLPVALAVVGPGERGRRFADPVPVAADARPGVRLLAHLGRSADPAR